jgi:hypothetical protein
MAAVGGAGAPTPMGGIPPELESLSDMQLRTFREAFSSFDPANDGSIVKTGAPDYNSGGTGYEQQLDAVTVRVYDRLRVLVACAHLTLSI